jgi:hypothetical protein
MRITEERLQLFAPDRRGRRTYPRSEFLEEHPQAIIVKPRRSFDDARYLRAVAWFQHTAERFGEVGR